MIHLHTARGVPLPSLAQDNGEIGDNQMNPEFEALIYSLMNISAFYHNDPNTKFMTPQEIIVASFTSMACAVQHAGKQEVWVDHDKAVPLLEYKTNFIDE